MSGAEIQENGDPFEKERGKEELEVVWGCNGGLPCIGFGKALCHAQQAGSQLVQFPYCCIFISGKMFCLLRERESVCVSCLSQLFKEPRSPVQEKG